MLPELTNQRQNIYIVCEEIDMVWDEQDIKEFERMWKEGLSIEDIAKSFDRDPDEVGLLIIDRSRKGMIQRRKGGLNGRRMPEGDTA